jgi:hypothetical protein
MALGDLADWLDEFNDPSFIWYAKRLSGNDTLANGSHQAGTYLPKEFAFSIFPAIAGTYVKNPDHRFELSVDSHMDHRTVRIVYYNNKHHGGGSRDEARITNYGGASSPLLDPDSTGSLAVFAFKLNAQGRAEACHVWVCDHGTEADLVEERIGPVEPGKGRAWSPSGSFLPLLAAGGIVAPAAQCWLQPSEIVPAWLINFPTGADIIRRAIALRPDKTLPPDKRLIRRRECEFNLFRSLEEAVELPEIKKGFGALEEFLAHAQSVLQRRKSRSGRSLELHTKEIFVEEGLIEGAMFSHGAESDPDKKPDFLFPSQAAYNDASFPAASLRMLAVKTTCKDRWRQVLNEADRIAHKHLLTLQHGVSENQFKEMTAAKVQLVVPRPLIEKYPKSVRPHLQTLESFIGDVRLLAPSSWGEKR